MNNLYLSCSCFCHLTHAMCKRTTVLKSIGVSVWNASYSDFVHTRSLELGPFCKTSRRLAGYDMHTRTHTQNEHTQRTRERILTPTSKRMLSYANATNTIQSRHHTRRENLCICASTTTHNLYYERVCIYLHARYLNHTKINIISQ